MYFFNLHIVLLFPISKDMLNKEKLWVIWVICAYLNEGSIVPTDICQKSWKKHLPSNCFNLKRSTQHLYGWGHIWKHSHTIVNINSISLHLRTHLNTHSGEKSNKWKKSWPIVKINSIAFMFVVLLCYVENIQIGTFW